MAIVLYFYPEPSFFAAKRRFERVDFFPELLDQVSRHYADMMVQEARMRIEGVSSRVAAGMEWKKQDAPENVIEYTVGSQFVGYPMSMSDMTGSAAEAASRGWATFAHRLEHGYYQGNPRQSGYNPRAGHTDPTPFLRPAFDRWSKEWYRTVRDDLIGNFIRGNL